MNNMAEGFERPTNRELRNFLYIDIAKGSCAEVRSMLYLAEVRSMLDPDRIQRLQ